MNPQLRRTVAGIKQWTPFARGLEAAETSYQAYGWQAPRRLVVVRETIRERPAARGRKLLEVPGYTFQVLVTTLGHDPGSTWRFYNSRAECEDRIKQLKDDFGTGGFCLHSFDGTTAAFRLIGFLFNLSADFKREVTHNQALRLMTLRTRLLVIGAIGGADGRQKVLRLGLRGRWRKTLCRAPGTDRRPRSFNCGAVRSRPKKSSALALETASATLPTTFTSSPQLRFFGSVNGATRAQVSAERVASSPVHPAPRPTIAPTHAHRPASWK